MNLRNTWRNAWKTKGDQLYVCLSCGYWGGIGFRDFNEHLHVGPTRGVIARYRPIEPLDHQETDYLVSHLRRSPKDLTRISPQRAEKFVVDLLSDYLGSEVRPLGGVKDKGIDGFILKSDRIRCIVQVKWHESSSGAECVRVVREVAGTLLAQGVPSGLLVSNRLRYSKEARAEAQEVSARQVVGVGHLSLSLMDYQDVIDMLELTATRLAAKMRLEDWFHVSESMCVFDGASFIRETSVKPYL